VGEDVVKLESVGIGGGGGGGGSFSPGPLLSGAAGNNNDTVLKAPLQGAMIVGNATPLWDRLAASGIQYHVLSLPDASGVTPTWGFVTGNNFGTSATPNLVFATLAAAGTGAPAFRALIGADLPFAGTIKNLTDAATIAVDAALWSLGGVVRVTVAADGHTFGAPSNPHDGQKLYLEILSSAAHTISFNAAYSGAIVALPTSTTGGGAVDVLLFAYRSNEALWFCIGNSQVAGGGSGTVTSVAMSVPAFLSIAGSPITTSGTLAVTLSGTALPAANGGTGQTSYSTGDILYASGATTLSKLAVSTNGFVLTLAGGLPTWAAATSSGPWQTTSTIVNLITSTNNVTIGAATAGGKLFIVGDTDEVQLQVRANATQTNQIATFEKSDGTVYVSILGTGQFCVGASQGTEPRVEGYRSDGAGFNLVARFFNESVDNTSTGAVGNSGNKSFRPVGNEGAQVLSAGTVATGGQNVGGSMLAGGAATNYGMWAACTVAASATNIAVLGFAAAGATTNVGGYFGFNTSLPTFTTAALMCDNAAVAADIFVARDNGAIVFKVGDGGVTTLLAGQTLRLVTAIGDANAASLLGSASLAFGAGGGSAVDVALVRSAVGILAATDGSSGIGTFKMLATKYVALTDAATIATDASTGNEFTVTLGANRTLGNPTNPTDGQKITWRFKQDGTGSRTITLDTKFRLGTDITAVTLSTAANKVDYMTALYNLTADLWDVVSLVKGY